LEALLPKSFPVSVILATAFFSFIRVVIELDWYTHTACLARIAMQVLAKGRLFLRSEPALAGDCVTSLAVQLITNHRS
jgi:hypothetical protein